MAGDPDDNTRWNNYGQRDASEGNCRHEPWRDAFESDDHFEGRTDAYNAGYDNAQDQKNEGSGCFLTSACMEYAELGDDCYELRTLRSFRDRYVSRLPDGPALLREYYADAPRVVRAIRLSPDRADLFGGIYAAISRAIRHIERAEHDSAMSVYSTLFRNLRRRFPAA